MSMKSSNVIKLRQDRDSFEGVFHLREGAVTGKSENPPKWTTDSHPFRLVRREPTVTHSEFVFIEEESKMSILKKKFKHKLEQAKRIREEVGDPVALGRSILEIPEDKANEVLSVHKGYKYVSKKS